MSNLKICFLLWCLIGAEKIVGQNISDLPANSAPFNFTGYTAKVFDNRYEGVKGTYTFFENFRPGTVDLKKGELTGVLINYDAYTQGYQESCSQQFFHGRSFR